MRCPGPAVAVMRLLLARGSGGVLPEGDDDVVAKGLELALGVAGLAAPVGVPGVPVGAEVAVAGGGVVEEVPDDDEDGPAHGAAGFLPPAAAGAGGEAAEPLAGERVGVSGAVGGQDGDALGVGVAVALFPAALAGSGLPGGRGEPGPGHKGVRGREAAHIEPYLGDQRGGGLPAQPGDLVEAVRCRQGGASPPCPASGPVVPS